MAVGEIALGPIYPVPGIRLGAAAAGIKRKNRDDVLLIALDEGSSCAGVFTQNAFCAAPVTIARQHLDTAATRYLLVNSGNANACTGAPGTAAAFDTLRAVSSLGDVPMASVLPFSTGVIGELLPAQKIIDALPEAFSALTEDGWQAAAAAIMTTDTRPKLASVKLDIEGAEIVVTGIAKGAGMIRPNMATMLGYIATNAKIDQSLLVQLSRQAANKSFNRITIDGDTSTNDACILMASGCSDMTEISSANNAGYQLVRSAIIEVYQSLSQQIVRDGEGATKFVTINVTGGENLQECLDIAYSIAHSPLVKTAMFASDPNWGRIVCAIGNAGIAELDVGKIDVSVGGVKIVEQGGRCSSYREEAGQAVFSQPEFAIDISLGRGDFSETIWTTDLSHEYVKINAEYRT